MLKNEVGSDGAATAVKKAINDNALLNEFAESISEPKNWLVGGAAAAATVAATIAVARYGRPLLGLGKEGAIEAENAVLATARGVASGGTAMEKPFMEPATDAVITASKKIGACPRPGETGILGIVKDGRIDPNVDTIMPSTFHVRGFAAETIGPATDAIAANGIPIRSSLAAEAPIKHTKLVVTEDGHWVTGGKAVDLFSGDPTLRTMHGPATEAIVKNSRPIDVSGSLHSVPGIMEPVEYKMVDLGHLPTATRETFPKAWMTNTEAMERITGNGSPRATLKPGAMREKYVPNAEGDNAYFQDAIAGHERLDHMFLHERPHGRPGDLMNTAELPEFMQYHPGLNDLKALSKASTEEKVLIKVDDSYQAMTPAEAVGRMSERTRASAARALAERMPKPATEADITAMSGQMAPSGSEAYVAHQRRIAAAMDEVRKATRSWLDSLPKTKA